jgi:hypothetical protein
MVIRGSSPLGLQGEGYLLLDLGEGAGEHRWLPAGHLLEVVLRFLRDLFKRFTPATSLAHSKHHVE